jgi:hypothetical protein
LLRYSYDIHKAELMISIFAIAEYKGHRAMVEKGGYSERVGKR